MSMKNKKSERGRREKSESVPPSLGSAATAEVESMGPTTSLKIVLSLFIFVHFAALFVALGSNLFQSALQQKLMSTLSPYLVSSSQAYGTTPLELTHGEPFDFPLRFEVQENGSAQWQTLEVCGLSRVRSTRWTNLMRSLRFILADDPESEVLSEFVFQLVKAAENEGVSVDAVRIVEPFLPDFDEAKLLNSGSSEFLETDDEVLFSAQIVRDGESTIGVLPQFEAYRSTQSRADGKTGRASREAAK